MNITFKLSIFHWHIAKFDVRFDIDEAPTVPGTPPKPKVMDSVSDYFANRWFARHS